MNIAWLWRRGAAEAGPRDGHASGLEELQYGPGLALAAASAIVDAPLPADPGAARRAILHQGLAVKLLAAHLANRFQTSYPMVLNLANYGTVHSGLLMGSAAATLLAVGESSARERGEAAERLRKFGAQGPQIEAFEAAFAKPAALAPLLDQVFAAGLASHAYAIALSILPRRTEVAKLHLAYLAARLKLGPELVGSLKRRFRA